MNILGVSAYYHDSAACLISDAGMYAASQERFTRRKHDPGLPVNAISYCLKEAGIIGEELDYVAVHEKPLRKFKRIVDDARRSFPRSYGLFRNSLPIWLGQKRAPESLLTAEFHTSCPYLFIGHHLSHAASAFLPSPFDDAAILTTDAVGEAFSTCLGHGRGSSVVLDRGIRFPNSLGMFYSALTHLLGFEVMEGEGKVMGLAAYGEPSFRKQMGELIRLHEDGSYALNMRYFAFDRSLNMITSRLEKLLFRRRRPDEPVEQRHSDLAATLQAVLEETLLSLLRVLKRETGARNLCMAGGIGLNSLANGRILREGPFENVFIQPAAGDSGCSLGAALYAHCHLVGRDRPAPMQTDRFGPCFGPDAIARFLDVRRVAYRRLEGEQLVTEVAKLLARNKIIGWFRGRMELGPRALGGRSILANPTDPQMKSVVNAKVKFREPFRPFGASVPEEAAADYFDIDRPSPFMMFVFPVRPEHRDRLPSITHVDGSCRIQTLSTDYDRVYHRLLHKFGELSGAPVLLNTSLNIKGDPIVCSPSDALDCFLKTGMDCLVMEDLLLQK